MRTCLLDPNRQENHLLWLNQNNCDKAIYRQIHHYVFPNFKTGLYQRKLNEPKTNSQDVLDIKPKLLNFLWTVLVMKSEVVWKKLILFLILTLYLPLFFSPSAPSQVTVIRKDRTSQNSISLSWLEPERPNGIILDYEVKYYEKVGAV